MPLRLSHVQVFHQLAVNHCHRLPFCLGLPPGLENPARASDNVVRRCKNRIGSIDLAGVDQGLAIKTQLKAAQKVQTQWLMLEAQQQQLTELEQGMMSLQQECDRIQVTLNQEPQLQSQLAQLNTSYQHTLDEARREKALELLDGSSMSIEQISMNLGYNDPSNFGRAFRRWLGQSPRAYRKSKQ